MKKIIVRTQEEMDAVPENFCGTVKIIGGTLDKPIIVTNNYSKARVKASRLSHVMALRSSNVKASRLSHVEELRLFNVEGYSSNIEAWGSSHAEGYYSSKVGECGSPHVEGYYSSHVGKS